MAFGALLISGCGQTGALYLPTEVDPATVNDRAAEPGPEPGSEPGSGSTAEPQPDDDAADAKP